MREAEYLGNGHFVGTGGKVIASQAVIDSLDVYAAASRYYFGALKVDDARWAKEFSGLGVYDVSSSRPAADRAQASPVSHRPAASDDRCLHPKLLALARRHACLDEYALAALDEQISSHLTHATILMFQIVAPSSAPGSSFTVQTCAEGMRSKQACLAELRPILTNHKGREMEPFLWRFASPHHAVRAALCAAAAARDRSDEFVVTGFGLHQGPLLEIRDTDVHWGDPVNTASKLACSVASQLPRPGQVLISSAVLSELQRVPQLDSGESTLRTEAVHAKVSGLQITAYAVTETRHIIQRIGSGEMMAEETDDSLKSIAETIAETERVLEEERALEEEGAAGKARMTAEAGDTGALVEHDVWKCAVCRPSPKIRPTPLQAHTMSMP